MEQFIAVSTISSLIILFSWVMTYEILGAVWNALPKLSIRPRMKVMLIGVPIFIIHISGIWIYAAAFFVIENYSTFGTLIGHGHVANGSSGDFLDCLYFSSSVYTSLGLGDIVPTQNLRMLVAAEVLNGLVLIGWTISFTYLTMEKFWQTPRPHTVEHHPHHRK